MLSKTEALQKLLNFPDLQMNFVSLAEGQNLLLRYNRALECFEKYSSKRRTWILVNPNDIPNDPFYKEKQNPFR